MLENLRLLVSEVVTNSLRHGGARPETESIEVTIEQIGDRIVVEVVDPGRGFVPSVCEPRPGQTSGWGLFLVDSIASRWGVHGDGATRVWFEIGRRSNARNSSD